ncbi:MAG: hypothetical protein HC828_07050 [Blastochloris sp.]|nr:hypothetical protein [Blastochloris sp.]
MAKTIAGLFDTSDEAHKVAQNLISGGFARADITVIGDHQPSAAQRIATVSLLTH